METMQEPQVDEVQAGDMEIFAKALAGEIDYGVGNESIERVEVFLMCWLNGLDYPNIQGHMTALYDRFKDVYPYNGRLYRSMSFENKLYPKPVIQAKALASYTDDIELAEDILDKQEGHTRYIYMTEAVQAFALDAMLAVIKEKTQNVDMEIVILDREWEQEKIHPFRPEENRLVWQDIDKSKLIPAEQNCLACGRVYINLFTSGDCPYCREIKENQERRKSESAVPL